MQIKQEESPSLLLSNIHNSDSLDSLNSVTDCGPGGGTGTGSNSGMGLGDEGTMSGSRGGLGAPGNNGSGSVSSLGGGILQQAINQKGNTGDVVGAKEPSGGSRINIKCSNTNSV